MKDEFRSSAFHFKDFLKTSVWQDMMYMINDMRDNIRDHLEVEKELEEMYRFQGRAEFAQVMLNLPSTILALLEKEQEDDELELEDLPDEEGMD